MRDNDIALGFNAALLDEANFGSLLPQFKSFIIKYPDLLHADAEITTLLESPEGNALAQATAAGDENSVYEGSTDGRLWAFIKSIVSEGSPSRAGRPVADWQQFQGLTSEGAADVGSLAEAFMSWLSNVYDTGVSPTFELGSLGFFRSHNHQAFFDHLDNAGDFYYQRVEDIPVHTLSASMFLPRQSVWNFRRMDVLQPMRPSRPVATPDPESVHGPVEADTANSPTHRGNPTKAMAARLAEWELIARDLVRQEEIPGLRSGNTVIDERNFALA